MTKKIAVSQEGCYEDFVETIERDERKEWVWPDANSPENIIVKIADPYNTDFAIDYID